VCLYLFWSRGEEQKPGSKTCLKSISILQVRVIVKGLGESLSEHCIGLEGTVCLVGVGGGFGYKDGKSSRNLFEPSHVSSTEEFNTDCNIV
jgi:hypothetical protein